MKILLPIDGSPFSARVVRYVTKHLQTFGKRPGITLVHVDSPLIERVSKYIGPEDIARFHEKNAATALAGARRMLSKAKIKFRERHLVGEASDCIARVAKEEGSDLIAMGSHGRGALKSLLLGSVVTKTLALTRVPVLVVR
jgi:nucleotide-binding universal stress UspA family protein